MWWGVGFFLALIYIALLVVLGLSTLRNGHVMLFILGFIFPVLWIIGAIMRPTERARGAGA